MPPLLLYLDNTGEGLPNDLDDIVAGASDGQRQRVVANGTGQQGFGSSSFGRAEVRIVDVSRIIRPSDRQSLDYRRVQSDKGDWQVEIPGRFDLHQWTEADAYVLDGTDVLFRGKVWEFEHQDGNNIARLAGPDLSGELDRGSVNTTYNAVPAWEAFQDYVAEYAPEWDVTVEPPDVSVVNEREIISEVYGSRQPFEDAFDITNTQPFHIRDAGIEPLQTCFTMDATETSERRIGGSADPESGNAESPLTSQGTYVRLEHIGDRAVYTIDPAYSIPQMRLGIRWDSANAPEVQVGIGEVDGNDDAMTITSGGEDPGLHWDEFAQFGTQLQDINGQTEIVVEVTDEGGGGVFFLDVVAPFDLRWEPWFDNDGVRTGDATYLGGPEHYPYEVQLYMDRAETSNNVNFARIDALWSSTLSGQSMAISNDSESWIGQPRSDGFSTYFNHTYGYGVQARFTFSWQTQEEVMATPRYGREPQRLEGIGIYVETEDLQIVEDLELTDTHFGNIQDLADRAKLKFYVDSTEREIDAFHRQQRQMDLPLYDATLDVAADEWSNIYDDGVYGGGRYGGGDPPHPGYRYEDLTSTKTTGTDYANVVRVFGARDDDGERVTGEARDEDEIAIMSQWGRDGEVVMSHVDGSIRTKTDAEAKADELLDDTAEEREFNGSVDGLPFGILHDVAIDPAVAYFVDEWNRHSILEEITVDDTGVSLDFEGEDGDVVVQFTKQTRRRAEDAHRGI